MSCYHCMWKRDWLGTRQGDGNACAVATTAAAPARCLCAAFVANHRVPSIAVNVSRLDSVSSQHHTVVLAGWTCLRCQPQLACSSQHVLSTASGSRSTPWLRAERLDRYDLRRLPKQPRDGFTIENVKMETVAPIPYDVLKEGVVQ